MGSGLRSIFEPEREYTVTELGGVKWGSPRQRMGLLGMGYDFSSAAGASPRVCPRRFSR